MVKINNEKETIQFNFKAEISIIDTTYTRELGFVIDASQRQEYVEVLRQSLQTLHCITKVGNYMLIVGQAQGFLNQA